MIRYYKDPANDRVVRRLYNCLDEHYNLVPDIAQIYTNGEWVDIGSYWTMARIYNLVQIPEDEVFLELI